MIIAEPGLIVFAIIDAAAKAADNAEVRLCADALFCKELQNKQKYKVVSLCWVTDQSGSLSFKEQGCRGGSDISDCKIVVVAHGNDNVFHNFTKYQSGRVQADSLRECKNFLLKIVKGAGRGIQAVTKMSLVACNAGSQKSNAKFCDELLKAIKSEDGRFAKCAISGWDDVVTVVDRDFVAHMKGNPRVIQEIIKREAAFASPSEADEYELDMQSALKAIATTGDRTADFRQQIKTKLLQPADLQSEPDFDSKLVGRKLIVPASATQSFIAKSLKVNSNTFFAKFDKVFWKANFQSIVSSYEKQPEFYVVVKAALDNPTALPKKNLAAAILKNCGLKTVDELIDSTDPKPMKVKKAISEFYVNKLKREYK